MKSIGIDIGTTTISFAVTDNDTLAVIQKYTIASAGFIHTENPWERIQDTDVILSRIRPVLNDILDTYSDISAIGITSQMHRLSARSEIIWAWYSQVESRPSSISVRLPVWDCLNSIS